MGKIDYQRLYWGTLASMAFIAVSGSAIFFVVEFIKKDNVEVKVLPVNMVNEKYVEPVVPIEDVSYRIWINWWSGKKNISTINNSARWVSSYSPLWYYLSKQGEIKSYKVANQSDIEMALEGKNLVATIGNDFDGERVNKLLDNHEQWEILVDEFIKIAQENNYSGWDLDWEQVWESDEVRYGDFLRYVESRFVSEDLKLAVSVHARTGQKSDWRGSKGHNLQILGQYADEVRVMAYDYHSNGSASGPVTPVAWLSDVINFVKSEVRQDKIVLGLPLYGYDWSEEGVPVTYEEAMGLVDKYGLVWEESQDGKTLWGKYEVNGIKHEVWVEGADSVVTKIELARKLGINKFIFWSAGGEDSSLWQNLP